MTSYSKDAVDREIVKDKRIKPREAKAIHSLLQGRNEPNESSMIAAHKAGQAYWRAHPRVLIEDAREEKLADVARSCGWHGADCEAWLAGFRGARIRALSAECVEEYQARYSD